MSARNSFREHRCNSVLPLLTPGQRATPSASSRRDLFPWASHYDRALTPYYDCSESDGTGFSTPDMRSEESDSSTGSVLERATADATRALTDEWRRVEHSLYDEDVPHVTRPPLAQECAQWKQLFPHLRVVGKQIPLPEKRPTYQPIPEEEVIAMDYSDYEEFSESEERHSASSSSDTTPQNSPRTHTHIPTQSRLYSSMLESRKREKPILPPSFNEGLNDSFYSMLQITPLYPRSPPGNGKRHSSSILKSEMSSSKWMRKETPDSPKVKLQCDRNSAKSFMSLDIRNRGEALSAIERKKVLNEARVCTAKPCKDRLQPLQSCQTVMYERGKRSSHVFASGKIWLPPLRVEEEKSKSLNYLIRNSSKKPLRSAASRAITLISECKNFDKT